MRKRLALLGALLALVALVTASDGRDGIGRPRSVGPILIGISAAKTGILAPYDLQSGQLFQMRINADQQGGRRTRQADQGRVDRHEVGQADCGDERQGADLEGCGGDHRHLRLRLLVPGDQRGERRRRCRASRSAPRRRRSPRRRSSATYGGSMGLGSDTEGTTMAEWMHARTAELKRAYVFKDNSLEYSKATADYFKARWTPARRHGLRRGHLRRRPEPRPQLAGHAPARQGRAAVT